MYEKLQYQDRSDDTSGKRDKTGVETEIECRECRIES